MWISVGAMRHRKECSNLGMEESGCRVGHLLQVKFTLDNMMKLHISPGIGTSIKQAEILKFKKTDYNSNNVENQL